MTVKDRVGRPRHVAFRVDADRPPSRQEMSDALHAALPPGAEPRLTRFNGRHGVVRVPHTLATEARAAMETMTRIGRSERPAHVTPLGTSGTLKGAVAKFVPNLARGQHPRPGPRAARSGDREERS